MPNEWQRQFGKLRRATDRKLLQECERQLPASEILKETIFAERGETYAQIKERVLDRLDAEARQRIARAFGRPV